MERWSCAALSSPRATSSPSTRMWYVWLWLRGMCVVYMCVFVYYVGLYSHLRMLTTSQPSLILSCTRTLGLASAPAQTIQLHEPYDVLFDKYKSKTLTLSKSKKIIK